MQLDETSPVDAEFAHRVARYASTHPDFLPQNETTLLDTWDGTFSPASRAATLEHALRTSAESISLTPYAALDVRVEQLRSAAWDVNVTPWSRAGQVDVFHPFGPIGFPFLNGTKFPGSGDEYTVRVQTPALSQSFRAVWEPAAWVRGGLALPTGESGEIGSRHYDDLSAGWIRGELRPLPFSDTAVAHAARSCLLLKQ
jgi:acyl-homoserine lactone acylase PvdQ